MPPDHGAVSIERKAVLRSGRIRVTERLIRARRAQAVLEIGAGDLSFSFLAEPSARWTRLDFAQPCDVVSDLNSDQAGLPFRDRSFDLVICTEVIEHLLWPQQIVRETYRVLGSGGALIVSVPNIVSASYRLSWLLGRLPSCAASANLPTEMGSTAYRTADGRYLAGHVVDFTRGRLEALLVRHGFRILSSKGSGIIWGRQILPTWAVPTTLASNIITVAERPAEGD